jgi:hypothetical protein
VAINDSGRIGGHVIAATDQSLPYYWTGETAEPIALSMPVEFPYGEIYCINATGVMVGVMWDDAGLEHAFVFDTTGGVRDLNDLIDPAAGWVLQFARDINGSGQIVGSGTHDGNERGFLLTPYEPLTIVVDGSGAAEGTVDAVPSGGVGASIQCVYPGTSPGPSCAAAYPAGTVVSRRDPGRQQRLRRVERRLLRDRLVRGHDERARHGRRSFELGGSCVVTVSNVTISTSASYQACHAILAGPVLAVVAPGDLTLRATTLVVLRNGVSIGNGARLTIALGDAPG